MHLVEQQRRISMMGPGGLPSADVVTPEAQNVHPSQFGFISPSEGPESQLAGVDVRAAWGTKLGSDGNIYQQFKDRRGKTVWLSPQDTQDKTIALPK